MKALIEIAIGFLLGIGSIVISLLYNSQEQHEIWVILLVNIATVYMGFGISDGKKTEKVREVIFELLVIIVAFLGLWASSLFLVFGYLIHGSWDLATKRSMINTNAQKWHPPFLMVFDWTIGIWLIWWFH